MGSASYVILLMLNMNVVINLMAREDYEKFSNKWNDTNRLVWMRNHLHSGKFR